MLPHPSESDSYGMTEAQKAVYWFERAKHWHDVAKGESAPLGDLARGYNAFWGWLRDHLSVEECEAVELAGVHPKDWEAAAEACIRAARGEPDPRPFTTYPDLER